MLTSFYFQNPYEETTEFETNTGVPEKESSSFNEYEKLHDSSIKKLLEIPENVEYLFISVIGIEDSTIFKIKLSEVNINLATSSKTSNIYLIWQLIFIVFIFIIF